LDNIQVFVGIPCVNEAENIGELLRQLKTVALDEHVKEICVISSGSTDRTDDIVTDFYRRNSKIKFIVEEERRGKTSAWNRLIRRAEEIGATIMVYLGGDNLPEDGAIHNLLSHFQNPKVGVVGGRPVPVNDVDQGFFGWYAHEFWNIHDIVSRKVAPKISGELMAFRVGVVREMPPAVVNDDFYLEECFRLSGYLCRYERNAVVYCKGPETVRDLIAQRRRVYAGHYQARFFFGRKPSTAQVSSMKYMFEGMPSKGMKGYAYLTFAILLQLVAYAVSKFDFVRCHIPYRWDLVKSTKELHKKVDWKG